MSKRLVCFSFVLCVVAMACMIVALIATGKTIQQPFTPPAFDSSVVAGTPDIPDALDWQELDAEVFKVGICGTITPQEDHMDVWLTNLQDNQVWLKVRVLDAEERILGESGLVRPGEYVQAITLQTVPVSGTPIVLKIMAYEPETYYSAGALTISTKIS